MDTQTQVRESPLAGATSPSRSRFRWVVLALLVLGGVIAAWWWMATPPLTEAEQQFVGKWTLPMGPNPPSNAVQQVYWLQPDRTFLMGHRGVNEAQVIYSMSGKWRLDGDSLVLQAVGARPSTSMWEVLSGSAPPPPRIDGRFHVLGWDGDEFRVEGEADSVATFLRLRN